MGSGCIFLVLKLQLGRKTHLGTLFLLHLHSKIQQDTECVLHHLLRNMELRYSIDWGMVNRPQVQIHLRNRIFQEDIQ